MEETGVEGAETTSGETLIEETETVETATEDFLKEMIQIQIQPNPNIIYFYPYE